MSFVIDQELSWAAEYLRSQVAGQGEEEKGKGSRSVLVRLGIQDEGLTLWQDHTGNKKQETCCIYLSIKGKDAGIRSLRRD